MKKPASRFQTWEGDEGGWAPSCAGPGCGRTLRSGDRYLVPRNSLVVLCQPCAEAPKEEPAPDPEPAPPKPKKTAQPKAERPKREPKPRPARGERPRKPTASCRACGVSFPAKSRGVGKRQVYCTPDCSYVGRRGPESLTPCERCGEPFRSRTHGRLGPQRFCSVRCARGGHERQERSCEYCAAPFSAHWEQAQGRYQRFCSFPCSQAAKAPAVRPCPGCGADVKAFSRGTNGIRTYCSRACAQRMRNRPVYDWSKCHAACVECGKTDQPHYGHGLCRRCYSRHQKGRKRGTEGVAA